ncbi:MAG: rhomboid family intramembrane serine protease [Oscillospiraceae bacterium]|nr:rhomboid family intramembrane serine protease [Oscillospiraceae bacterium]
MLRIRYNAPVVLTYALLALLLLPLDTLTGGWTTLHLFSVYRCSLLDPLAYIRFFGHVLGHAGLAHYMSNMLLLLLVGAPLEEKYGSRALLLYIAATALATGLVEFLFFPGSALLGASGVVFMMIVLSSFTATERGAVPLTLILVVTLYLGGEIVAGLRSADNISQLTHIVGGVCGMVFAFSGGGAKRGRRR